MNVQKKKNKVVKIVNEMLSEKRKESVPSIKTWDVIKPKIKNKINKCIIGGSLNEDDIILVEDDTILGTGKKGIVFTLTGFYCSESYNSEYKNNPMDKIVFPIEYNKIKKCELNANQSYINVVFQDDTVKYLNAGIYGIFVQALINNILECMKPDADDYAEEAERLARHYIKDNDGQTIKRSYDLYRKAIELGDVRSKFYAASIMICEYSKGTIEFDYDKCLGWLKDAAAVGYQEKKSLKLINKLYEMEYNQYLEMEEDSGERSKFVEEKAHLGNSIMMFLYGIEIQNTDKLEGIIYILTSFKQKFFNVVYDSTIRKRFTDTIKNVEKFRPTYEMIRDKRYSKIISLLKQLIGDDEFFLCVKEEAREFMREKIRKIYDRLSDTETLIENLYYSLPEESQKEFVMEGLNDPFPIFKLLVGINYKDYGLTMDMQINNISLIISECSEDQIKEHCAKIFCMMAALGSFYLDNIRYYEVCMVWWKRLSKYKNEICKYVDEDHTEIYEYMASSVSNLVCGVLCKDMEYAKKKVNIKYLQDYFMDSDATRYQKVPLIEFVKMYVDEKKDIYEQMEIISESLPRVIRETGRDALGIIGETILQWKLEEIYHTYKKLLDTQYEPKYETAIKRVLQDKSAKQICERIGYDEFYEMCCESYKLEKLCCKKTGELRKYLEFFKSMEQCLSLLEIKKIIPGDKKSLIGLNLVFLKMGRSVYMIETAIDPQKTFIDLDEYL